MLDAPIRAYDVTPDGAFPVNVPSEQRLTEPATLVINWQPRNSNTESQKH